MVSIEAKDKELISKRFVNVAFYANGVSPTPDTKFRMSVCVCVCVCVCVKESVI